MRRKVFDNSNALTAVISGILALMISVSCVGSVLFVGTQQIESEKKSLVESSGRTQLDAMANNIYKLANSAEGDSKTINLALDSDSSIISNEEKDTTVLMYSVNSDYDFSISGLEDSDNTFDIVMTTGEITDVNLFWFDFKDTCFLSGTKVLMANGLYKNIEDVVVGDIVKSYNEISGEILNSKVSKVFYHTPEEMQSYYLIINENLKVTPNHKFFSNGNWVFAGDLNIGDVLYTYKKVDYYITSVQKIFGQVHTYDIEIEDFHTYYVSIGNRVDILVHNPTIIVKPTVETLDATEITSSSVEFNGYLTKDGGETCQIAFSYCEVGGSEVWTSTGWSGSYKTDQSFSYLLEDLISDTDYQFQAGARNSAGISWGEILAFHTQSNIYSPTVTTTNPSNIGTNSVRLNGCLQDDGGESCLIRFKYRIIGFATWVYPSNWHGYYSEVYNFYEDLNGLLSNTNYEYQAGARNSASEVWGISKTFTTLANNIPPTCEINADPLSGVAPLTVSFGLIAQDSDGYIQSWSLDIDNNGNPDYFGNGNPPHIEHTYINSGYYTVKFTVVDDDGASAYEYIDIDVDDKPNNPPTVPFNPYPTNGLTGLGVNIGLSWSCTDPENDPLQFDVYFDTVNPPTFKISSKQVSNNYASNHPLITGQDYYWKIVAYDGKGGVTQGPIWNFKVTEVQSRNDNRYIEKSSNIILEDNNFVGIYTVTSEERDFRGTVVIDLYNNQEYIGSIWMFESNSITYSQSSSKDTQYIIENGGVLEGNNEYYNLKKIPIKYANSNILSFDIIQLVKSSLSNVASSGKSPTINLQNKGNGMTRSDTYINIDIFKMQIYGSNKDIWQNYYDQYYNFDIEDISTSSGIVSSLRYDYNDVTLMLYHSYLEFQIIN